MPRAKSPRMSVARPRSAPLVPCHGPGHDFAGYLIGGVGAAAQFVAHGRDGSSGHPGFLRRRTLHSLGDSGVPLPVREHVDRPVQVALERQGCKRRSSGPTP